MSAQIINLQAWRVAHSERPALCLELLRAGNAVCPPVACDLIQAIRRAA